MEKKATFLLLHLIAIVMTYVVAGFTIAAWFAGITPPQESWFVSMLGLGMIPLLAVNLALFLVWIIQRKWLAIAPAAVILLNIGFIAAMFQFDFGEKPSFRRETGLKIATYNIRGFANTDLKKTLENISAYMDREGVDVICFQEFGTTPECPADSIRATFAPTMPYSVIESRGKGMGTAIFSKYPIRASEHIPFINTLNSAIWADIEVQGEIVRVFNAHFQTTGITLSQHEIKELQERGITDYKGKQAFDAIMDRLRQNAYRRTEQVEAVRSVMDMTPHPILFCGDFNDTPASYTYKQIKKGLTDSFKSCGSGYGYTFKPMLKIFRLDYVLYDPKFEGIRYHSPSLFWSDHNPVMVELSLRNGEKEG